MRVGIDATPLLGPRTGIGRYVEGLLGGFASLAAPPELVLTGFTWRGGEALAGLASSAGAGTTVATRRAPARLLQAAWSHLPVPPVEWLSGPVDVFHGTNFVLPPARRAAGVLNVHDLSYLRHPETVSLATLRYRQLVPRALARGAHVLCISDVLAAEVRAEYRLAEERVTVTPLGVDERWFTAEPPSVDWLQAHDLPPRYVLFVGSVEPRKQLPLLLRAYARVLAEMPDAPPLVLAGPAGWGEPLDVSGLPARAVFRTGYLDDSSLRRVVRGASALAFPSKHEGFGLPPLEALACGVPVVCSDLPVLREVCGPCARYSPVDDVDALAEQLVGVLLRGDDSDALREARRDRARMFTWERTARLTMDAYAAALAAR